MLVILGAIAAVFWAWGAKERRYEVTVGDGVSIVTTTHDREPLPGVYEGPSIDHETGESRFSPYKPISMWRTDFDSVPVEDL